ncbi:MAG: cytochrome c1 [Rhodoferax sp.]
MKKTLLVLLAAFGFSVAAHASSGGIAWDKAPVDVNNKESLQRGAKLFVNYCLSCHSAAFMRYNRLKDIGLTEQQIKDNLMFTTDKVGDTMKANIDPKQAKEWFGANPPDLTLIARSRAGSQGSGADYLYTYLRSYYPDETKATGWNNLAFPNVGMPHVLWELQGSRKPIIEGSLDQGGHVKGWEQLSPGTMAPQEYDAAVADLVNFLQWMGEPAQTQRKTLGIAVLAFLLLLCFVTWRLNQAYWKEVH